MARPKKKRISKIETAEVVKSTEPTEVTKAEELPATPEPIKPVKNYRRPIFITLGLLLFAGGLGLFYGYFTTLNILFAILSVVLLGAGGWLTWHLWHLDDSKGVILSERIQKEDKKQPMNSLNIYPNEIVFSSMPVKDCKGQPMQCLNTGKHYFVQIYDKAASGLKAFELPDLQYYDPRVFAERVLTLPAHQRLFTRKEKIGEVIKIGLLIVAFAGIFILIVATTGKGA